MGNSSSIRIKVGKSSRISLLPGSTPYSGVKSPAAPSFSPTPWLNSAQLLHKIYSALVNRQGLAVVSIGQTEAFIMAQYVLFSEEEFMNHREAEIANQGSREGFMHRGVRFPNIAARDAAVEAVKNADIVGYNTIEPVAHDLTKKVFALHQIRPRFYFEAHMRRVLMFSQKERFERLLAGRRILLVGALAQQAAVVLDTKWKRRLKFDIAAAIPIYEFEEIPWAKEQIARYDFDLCLLGAGVNAVILSSYIARHLGKVAIDLGSGMESLVTGKIVTDSFINEVIGLDQLMQM